MVVVEGRSRAGGRVHSSRLEQLGASGVGELGGSVLTGVDGNPLAVIARQLGEPMHTIGMRCVISKAECVHRNQLEFAAPSPIFRCPLYMADGLPVPVDIDEKVCSRVACAGNYRV